MDLITLEEDQSRSVVFSTLQHVASESLNNNGHRDASSLKHNAPFSAPHISQNELDAMEAVLRKYPNPDIAADELTLTEAAQRRELYDKTLLLIQHGEDFGQALLTKDVAGSSNLHNNPVEKAAFQENPESLTGKGIGQSLNLARRMATLSCNYQYQHHRESPSSPSRLDPELVVVAPLKKVLQTTYLAFPYQTPRHAIRKCTPWICHPDTLDPRRDNSVGVRRTATALQREFGGVDCSLLDDYDDSLLQQLPTAAPTTLPSREEQLLQRADNLLDWLRARPERFIVVSGEAIWLNYLARRLSSSRTPLSAPDATATWSPIANAELKAYGLHYLSP